MEFYEGVCFIPVKTLNSNTFEHPILELRVLSQTTGKQGLIGNQKVKFETKQQLYNKSFGSHSICLLWGEEQKGSLSILKVVYKLLMVQLVHFL